MTTLLVEFRAAMVRRNLRPGSISKRLGEVRAWLRWCASHEVPWETATWRHVEAWLDARPIAPRARASAVSHLHRFYQWARRVELAAVDPTELVERPRLKPGQPRPMPELYVDMALEQAEGRMRTMVSLMAWAGLRCGEVATLQWSDVDLEARTLHVLGKGERERTVAMSPKLVEHLASLDGTDGLVVGRRYSACRVSQLVNAFLKSIGISRPFTAHSLRHRKATVLCEQTEDLEAVRQYMGHASVATTQIYVEVARARVMALAQLAD